MTTPHTKVCRLCQRRKPLIAFLPSPREPDGRMRSCKACTIGKADAYRTQ